MAGRKLCLAIEQLFVVAEYPSDPGVKFDRTCSLLFDSRWFNPSTDFVERTFDVLDYILDPGKLPRCAIQLRFDGLQA